MTLCQQQKINSTVLLQDAKVILRLFISGFRAWKTACSAPRLERMSSSSGACDVVSKSNGVQETLRPDDGAGVTHVVYVFSVMSDEPVCTA